VARSIDIAMTNLRAAITDMELQLEAFGQGHKKVIAFGAVVYGEVRGVLVLAGDDLYSPVGPDRMRTWARMIGHLPTELLSTFEAELAAIKASHKED
jgi:hypothetical protein